jgi:hypothetical protein
LISNNNAFSHATVTFDPSSRSQFSQEATSLIQSVKEREKRESKTFQNWYFQKKDVLADTCIRLSVREKSTTPASRCGLSCIMFGPNFVQNAQMIEKRALRLGKIETKHQIWFPLDRNPSSSFCMLGKKFNLHQGFSDCLADSFRSLRRRETSCRPPSCLRPWRSLAIQTSACRLRLGTALSWSLV